MLIVVTERGFLWKPDNGPAQTAQGLRSPFHCYHEEMAVLRSGREIDRCRIEWVGTHGASPMFVGFENLFGKGNTHHHTLNICVFQTGDELHIKELPHGTSELEYWNYMTKKWHEW